MAKKLKNSTTDTVSQFNFPHARSKIIPDPSEFFSSTLLSSPLPTTSFFTNFVIGNGDQATFIHPYLIKLSLSSLSLSYPSLSSSPSSISQKFSPDFTISTSNSSRHVVSSFSDLTVTVDFLSSDFRFLLARGSPYVTLEVSRPLPLSISTSSAIQSISPSKSSKKHRIGLKNKQVWVVYSSSELSLNKVDNTHIISLKFFSGVVRIAIIPNQNGVKSEEILDSYSTCYASSGEAIISTPFSMEYKWKTEGWGQLLMLAHPLHLKLLSIYNSGIKVLDNFKYECIDGNLVGIIGNQWKLRVDNISISWHSRSGISEENYHEIVSALREDSKALKSTPITATHVLHYAKQVSKAARLALVAEEVNCGKVIPEIIEYLRKKIEPWLVGSFAKNGFLYDEQWGGVISKQGLTDVNADNGFGLYRNHHWTLGYFVFSIAVLAKLDKKWGKKFRNQAYALVGSYMSLKEKQKSNTRTNKYTKLRSFDVYKLHSWEKSLGNGNERDSENPSASIHAYYAASLLGLAYGDDHLSSVGSTLASFEIEAVKTWWHVKEGGVYKGEFVKENKVVGISWESKREGKLSFAAAEHTECRVGIQVKPFMPVLSEVLFSDVGFVRELVDWATPALAGREATDDWKGLVYALEAMFDNENALKKVKNLKGFSEENSMSIMLWWVHSLLGRKNWCSWCNQEAKDCWYCASCS